jgi:fucose 4-O-acetylase-like acetyltransferase
MYSLLSTLFVIGVFLVVAGFLGRVGTDGISDVNENVAAAIGLLVTYAFLILSLGSFSELATFFEGICGGIPFLNEIADYGSLQKALSGSSLSFSVAFLDTVIFFYYHRDNYAPSLNTRKCNRKVYG